MKENDEVMVYLRTDEQNIMVWLNGSLHYYIMNDVFSVSWNHQVAQS
jgi:hypothetical protein